MMFYTLFFSLISSQFINIVILPVRPIYISKQITSDHVFAIYDALHEYNRYSTLIWNGDELFTVTEDKTLNHIRIEYASYNGCSMSAQSMSDGYFMVSETLIGFQKELDYSMTQCIILHELGHALGLSHNNLTGSIMSEIISQQSYTCTLKQKDLIHLYKINNGEY